MKKFLLISLLSSVYILTAAQEADSLSSLSVVAARRHSSGGSLGKSGRRSPLTPVDSAVFQRTKSGDRSNTLTFTFPDPHSLDIDTVSSGEEDLSRSIDSVTSARSPRQVHFEIDQDIKNEVVFKGERDDGEPFMLVLAQVSDGEKEKNVLIIPVNSDSNSQKLMINDFLPGDYDSHEEIKEGDYDGGIEVKMLIRIDPILLERFITFDVQGKIVADKYGKKIPYQPKPEQVFPTYKFEAC
ncbi:MAG: hypothetical protein ACJAZS_000585 [Alteromonas naphthalenivorans]|jgi:hypothetical protein